MGKVIGIDLGTTNSVVAIMEDGVPKVLINEEGNRTTPSVVAFDKENNRLVGQIAKRQAVTNPENTIFSSKRFIGKKIEEVKSELNLVPYKVIENKDRVAFSIRNQKISPEEIGSAILLKLKKVAEDYLGEEVKDAIITVPAYFGNREREATINAAKIAGLNVLRIINEPTAAALAFGADQKKNSKVVVVDTGGGTHDVSVLEIGEGVIEVKSTNGDTHLGGDDFDHMVMEHLMTSFKQKEGIDLKKDKMALQRLKEASEKAKIELSQAQETEINLPFITADQTGPKHLQEKLTRSKFDQLTESLIKRIIEPCKKALSDAGLNPSEIDEVLLVGGSTRIPSIQKVVKDFFGKDPNKSLNPDEVVALGAAIQGGILKGEVKDVLLLDVTPLSLGLETLGGVMTTLIPRNTTVPTKKSQLFSTAVDNQPAVSVHVLQGERKMAEGNKTLGMFELGDIAPQPKGEPQIEVTFDIDANGVIEVSAKDLKTNKKNSIKITSSGGLTDQEIKKAVEEAESYKEADEAKLKLAEAKNKLESLFNEAEKNKVDSKLVEKAKKALKEANLAEMEKVTRSLSEALKESINQSYEEVKAPKKEDDKGDDVIDAEYKDIK